MPPYLRVVEASACVKGENSAPAWSGRMPMPVSAMRETNSYRTLLPPTLQPPGIHAYAAAFGEFDGIRAEIGQYLAQPVGIAAHQRRNLRRHAPIDVESLCGCLVAQQADHFFHDPMRTEVQIFEDDPARLDLRKVENVVDESQQRSTTLVCATSANRRCSGVRSVSSSS